MSDAFDTEFLMPLYSNNRVFPRPWNDLPLPPNAFKNLEKFSESDLIKTLQTEYWWAGDFKVSTGPGLCSNFKAKWLPFAPESRQIESRVELTEYQVVRECLWVILGAQKSFIFVSYTDSEILTKNFCLYTRKPAALTHLTYGALDTFCTEIAESATSILQIKAFINFVLLSSSSIPLPFIRLAQFCERLVGDAFRVVSELEQVAKSADSIQLTLILLSIKWQVWFRRLSFISTLILQVCSPQLNTIYSGETSILLLNRIEELSRTISKCFPDPYLIDLIGEIFVSTTEAYLCHMMRGCSLNSTPFLKYNESMLSTDPSFWESGVTLIKSSVPNVLSSVIHDVFLGAKSFILLKAISSTFRNPKLLSAVEDSFNSSLSLNKERDSKEDIDGGVREFEYHDDSDVQEMVRFMESIVLDKPKCVLLTSPSKKSLGSPAKTVKRLSEDINNQASKISSHLVSSLLHGPLSESGTWLPAVSSFADDLNLTHAFENLSKIAFFRSGEWMYAFCEEVFSSHPSNRTESFLNKALREQAIVICGERSWLCGRLKLILAEKNISLKISVPWPLNIVISEEKVLLYQNTFKFLLELKQAKWALDNAKWTFGTGNPKLALLRSRYLYVINGIHTFIADHIEVAHMKFMGTLIGSDIRSSLNNLLTSFSTYLARVKDISLLSDSASQKMLNQTLRELFELCAKFQSPCEMDVEYFASEFSTRVGFLRTVLSEALQGSGYVRLEASYLLKTLEDSCRFNTGVITRLHL
nr:gamma tubulin complex component 5 [Hymenolepis microstoma]